MKKLLLLLALCSLASGQTTAVFNGNTVINGNMLIPAPQSTPPPISPILFALEEHGISDPNAYPTIPFGFYREYGTSCQWNNMWTGTGDTYNFPCFLAQINYANLFGVPLMFTFGQMPSGLSTISPDNTVGAPAQFPVAINGVAINCGSGTCTATVTTLQRLNATSGASPGLTLNGAVGCPENPNGTFITSSVNNQTDYPWTYTFNIGAGTVSSSACGGPGMTLADNAQTATRCSGTGSAPGGQSGGCYSPNDINVDGTGTDAHFISFATQLLAFDAANDPNHVLKFLEMWNEPQGAGFFNGSIAQMARMQRDLNTVIQASAQASYMKATSPAPSGGLTSPANYLGLYGADPSNPLQYACCIDNHTYNFSNGAGTPDPMSAITIASNVRAAIAPFPAAAGKPQFATEGSYGFGPFGASTTNQGPNTGTAAGGDKAGWVVDAYFAHFCANYALYSFFAWDQACHTGLACATPPPPYSIDPAGIAYGIAHDWLVGANVSQSCSKDGAGNWTLKIQRGTYNATAFWNTGLTTLGSIPVTAGQYVDYRDIFGNVNPINPTATALPIQFDPILAETQAVPFRITNPSTLPSGSSGVAYSQVINTAGATGAVKCKERTLPSQLATLGMSLSGCTIIGTPSTTGTINFQIGVLDANGLSNELNFSLSINSATTLTVTSGPCPGTGTVGNTYTCTLTATGGTGTGYVWTLVAGSNPGGTNLTTASGIGTVTGVLTTATTYNPAYLVTDSGGHTARAPTTGTFTIIVSPGVAPLVVTTVSCPNGINGSSYTCTLNAMGGTPPYVWTQTAGVLPPSTSLTTVSSAGIISGTLTAAGSFSPSGIVTDSTGGTPLTAPWGPYPITVSNSTGGADDNRYCGAGDVWTGGLTDGPSLLPTHCINTALVNTPNTGATFTAVSCGTVQSTINSAAAANPPGKAIIPASLTACVGPFTIPVVTNGSAAHWLWIETDQTANVNFPPEGTRATPCQIGLASDIDLPPYSCPTASRLMPQLMCNVVNCTVFTFATSAAWVRFIGIEVIGPPSINSNNYLIPITNQNDHIIIDRSVVHGQPNPTYSPTLEDKGGITTNGSTNLAVINSTVYDFLCVKGGACVDSQAIAGGLGSIAGGPFKIVNNLLSASGETWIWGGGAATANPADFEIRRNHSYKPLIWFQPTGGVANPYAVIKNLGELKNGIRALFEGNISENNWGGFQGDQFGNVWVFTPKSQSGACPLCTVQNVTVRYNILRHAANGLSIANALSDTGAASSSIFFVSVHDNQLDDINPVTYSNATSPCCSNGFAFKISNVDPNSTFWPHDISIIHNTAINSGFSGGKGNGLIFQCDGAVSSTGTVPVTYFANVNISNNIGVDPSLGYMRGGCGLNYPSSGALGMLNGGECSGHDGTTGCTFTFTKNVMLTGVYTGQISGAPYPATNLTCGISSTSCLTTVPIVQFTTFNSGNGGNYLLLPSSPFHNQGTDGFDLGANIGLVMSFTAGVL